MRRAGATQVVVVVRGQDEASAVFKSIAGELSKQSQESAKGLTVLDGMMVSIGQRLTGWAKQLPGAVKDLTMLGAQSQAAAHRLRSFAGGAEEADAQLAAFMAGADGAVDRMTAMSGASRLLQMGLVQDAESMEMVAAMATKLGDQTESASQRVQGFALMLANTSIPRLDNYGISSGVVRKRIEELQKATYGLSREEAFKTAVFEEGRKALEKMGETSDLLLTRLEKVNAASQDAKIGFGEMFAEVVDGIIPLEELADRVRRLPAAAKELYMLGSGLDAAVTAFFKGEDAAAAFTRSVELSHLTSREHLHWLEQNVNELDGWHAAMTGAESATGDLVIITRELSEEAKAATAAWAGWTSTLLQFDGQIGVMRENWQGFAEMIGAELPRQKEGWELLGGAVNFLTEAFGEAGPKFEEMAEKQRVLAAEGERVAAAWGDEFVGLLGDAVRGADELSMALFGATDAAGANWQELGILAAELGIATDAEIEAAVQALQLKMAMEEMAEGIRAGTITIGQAVAALREMKTELPEGVALLNQQAQGARSVASATSRMSEADREAAKRKRELARAMAMTGDYFVDNLKNMGAATLSTDQWSAALFKAADAEGASSKQLFALSQSLGLFSEEQARLALQRAAMQEQIVSLGRAIARGMSQTEAMRRFTRFRAQFGLEPIAAQHGLDMMVGPGHGGPRMVLAGEGMFPERVMVSPMMGARNYHLGGNTYNVYDQRAAMTLAQQDRIKTQAVMMGAIQ